jgi:glycosyltransferase involved in cell wall biosynthesis
MYTDDSDQIISEKVKMNPQKKKKIFKKILKTDNNESYDCTCVVSALMISILIILIINIYNLVSLYKDMDNLENIKNINTEENKNEDSNMKIYKEQKKPENPNPNNVIEENTELSRNISINLTEEIDNFVKSQRKISAKEINDFRLLNSQNILFDKIKYRKSESPDVSIILTVNNQAHCIHKALRSIQNQSLKNIEIIVSVDCSKDNSTEVIKKYMEEDERIVLIEHSTRDGIMKTRGDGFKIAKGKYITAVDGDDALIQKDILNNSFHIARMGDLDVVEFFGAMFVKNINKGYIHYHGVKGILGQPQLRTRFFDVKEDRDDWRPIMCRSIWAKLIRNSVFQKVLEQVGSKYMDSFMNNYEDTILTVTLFQIAQSYYMFKQVGYYYSRDENTGRYPAIPGKQCPYNNNTIHNYKMDELKFINYLYDNMADNEIERKTLCHEIISINYYDFSNFGKRVQKDFDMFYRVVDGIIDSKYLSEREKEKLRNITLEVKQKEEKERNKNNNNN